MVTRAIKRIRATRPTTVKTPATAPVFWKNLEVSREMSVKRYGEE